MLDAVLHHCPYWVLLASAKRWNRTAPAVSTTHPFRLFIFFLINKEGWNNRKKQSSSHIAQLQKGLFFFFFLKRERIFPKLTARTISACCERARQTAGRASSALHVKGAPAARRRKGKAWCSEMLCLRWCLCTSVARRYSDQTHLQKMSFSPLLLLQIFGSANSLLFSQHPCPSERLQMFLQQHAPSEGKSGQTFGLPLPWLCCSPYWAVCPSTAVDFTYSLSKVQYMQWEGPVCPGKTGQVPKVTLQSLTSDSCCMASQSPTKIPETHKVHPLPPQPLSALPCCSKEKKGRSKSFTWLSYANC